MALVAVQEPLRQVAIALAEQEQRGDAEPGASPARSHSLSENPLVVAVEVGDRVGPRGLPEAVDVQLDLPPREGRPDIAAREDVAGDPAVGERAAADSGGRDHPRVPGAPGLRQEPGGRSQEWMWCITDDHPRDPLG